MIIQPFVGPTQYDFFTILSIQMVWHVAKYGLAMNTVQIIARYFYRRLRRIWNVQKRNLLAIDGGLPIKESMLQAVPYKFTHADAKRVYDIVYSGKLTHDSGSQIVNFEREFAQYTGAKFAVATNSGTSALHMAVQAIGLQHGDEVIVPAYTFIATAQAVLSCGAIPVFVDIDKSCTVSPSHLERVITKKTRAIMVVHVFGNIADMDAILSIAQKYKLLVIEDCAQAVGGMYKGKHVGTLGDVGCFSFNIHKAIPTGQGGMLITNSNDIYRSARAARNTGIEHQGGTHDVVAFGGTYFMTEMEASLGRSVLRQLEYLNRKRRNNYAYLSELLQAIPQVHQYEICDGATPVYSRVSLLINFSSLRYSRQQFIDAVRAEGVPLKIFYPTPLYKYQLFQRKYDEITGVRFPFSTDTHRVYTKMRLAGAEKFFVRHVGFEFNPYWTSSDMRVIVSALKKVITHATL